MADTAQARGEAALRRDAALEAVAFAAQRFLETPDWGSVLPQVLRRLGEATGVSRVSLSRNRPAADGDILATVRHEWTAPGVRATIGDAAVTGAGYAADGFERWVEILSRGDVLHGIVRDLPEAERRELEARDIRSIVFVPIFVDGEWWGGIGFDDCLEERVWTQIEIDALRAAAATIGAAISRRHSEEQLRRAEERFRAIVERTPVITYQERAVDIPDSGSSVLYVSPQVERLLGYPAEKWWEIPGFWTQIVHPDDLDRVSAESERTGITGEPYAQDYRMVAADGRVVWFHDESILIRDKAGRPEVWQGVMLDVTEQKQTEARFREAEATYRALVEHIPAVTYRQTTDGDPEHFYVSPQVQEVFGYTTQEWTWTPNFWLDHVHPDDREWIADADLQTDRTGEPVDLEYRFQRSDGEYVWVHDQAVLVRREGGPDFWQGFIQDVTERKAGEERLEHALQVERDAAERLRALDEMKNTFLQAVSHDLRTPLAAILGLAVTLERVDLELETDDSRDMAKRIAVNARKLDRMVSDLLDLDRLARGIVEPRRHATDVGALVRRVVDESDLTTRGVEVDAPELVANVDPAKVERIVENLLANTLRHTPKDTRVWVRIGRTDAGVLIVVEDDGPGVPEAHRQAIFEPFRQGPDAPEHSPGVGVGLALVARFAELLGGRAWVQDREGGGASFRVLVADEPSATPDAASTG
jgi:PAS domain S-box-containing protein